MNSMALNKHFPHRQYLANVFFIYPTHMFHAKYFILKIVEIHYVLEKGTHTHGAMNFPQTEHFSP